VAFQKNIYEKLRCVLSKTFAIYVFFFDYANDFDRFFRLKTSFFAQWIHLGFFDKWKVLVVV